MIETQDYVNEHMDKEKAISLLNRTPEYIRGPCPRCGAKTFEDASIMCRTFQMPCGDYSCGSPDEGPNAENESGPLYQRNPKYDKLDGYLWGWYAFEEKLTTVPPIWEGDQPTD